MATNKSPQLIILTTETKREQLKAYALANGKSMGWLVNQLIDRLLAGETILELPDTTRVSEPTISLEPIEKRLSDIERQLLSLEPIEKRLSDIEQLMVSKEPEIVTESQERVTKVEGIEIEKPIELSIEKLTSFTWTGFHKLIDIPHPKDRNRANGDKAVTIARDKGLGEYRYNSAKFTFTKS
jgi:hypothetical protein